MLKSIGQGYPETDISINIIWITMLPSDSEAAAREVSSLFDDPRVHQFWDPNQRSGIAYSRDVFPRWTQEMISSVPSGDWMVPAMQGRAAGSPTQAPLWDVAFFYDRGPKWSEKPPTPKLWTKQAAFYGDQADGISGRFWRNKFADPPVDSDWFVELSRGMKQLTGKEPVETNSARESNEPAVATLDSPSADTGNRLIAKLIVVHVAGLANNADAEAVAAALRAMKGAIRVSADAEGKLVSVLTKADGPLTAERVTQYLSLAGYEAREGTPQEYQTAEKELQGNVLAIPADAVLTEGAIDLASPSERISPPELISLADSLEPLRARFNDAKDKVRFVALLSPT